MKLFYITQYSLEKSTGLKNKSYDRSNKTYTRTLW